MILELLRACDSYTVELTELNSVLELLGLTSGNKSLAELLTLPRQPVCSAASARPIILVCFCFLDCYYYRNNVLTNY